MQVPKIAPDLSRLFFFRPQPTKASGMIIDINQRIGGMTLSPAALISMCNLQTVIYSVHINIYIDSLQMYDLDNIYYTNIYIKICYLSNIEGLSYILFGCCRKYLLGKIGNHIYHLCAYHYCST